MWLKLNIDGDDSLLKEVERLLEDYKRDKKTLLSSAEGVNHTKFLSIASNKELFSIYLQYVSGVLPFKEITYQAVEIPLVNESYKSIVYQSYTSSKYMKNDDGDNWKYRLHLRLLALITAI